MIYKSRTATKQMWLVIISAIGLSFFLLYIGLKRGNDSGFWITFPASMAAIWGFCSLMWNSLENRKGKENSKEKD
jgi:Na+-driven multidrug efflux pump